MTQKITPEFDMYPENKTDNETSKGKNRATDSTMAQDTTLLKKNEFTMIIGVALMATALVFFFFFRGASIQQVDTSTQERSEQDVVSEILEKKVGQAATGLDSRIGALEVALAKIASDSDQNRNHAESQAVSDASQAILDLEDRISRLEAASNMKFDILNERLNKLDDIGERVDQVDALSARLEKFGAINRRLDKVDTLLKRVDRLEGRLKKVAATASTRMPPPKRIVQSPPEVKKPVTVKTVQDVKIKTAQPVKQKAAPDIKTKTAHTATKKGNQSSHFHTVQKGETLWSISRKYNIDLATIRKLNNMGPEDKLYLGSKVLVK